MLQELYAPLQLRPISFLLFVIRGAADPLVIQEVVQVAYLKYPSYREKVFRNSLIHIHSYVRIHTHSFAYSDTVQVSVRSE